MDNAARLLLDNVLRVYQDIQIQAQHDDCQLMSENKMWKELCFCILSSNVPFELAFSAFKHLDENGLLEPYSLKEERRNGSTIASELSKKRYLPLRKDGTMRRYRFPKLRAENIISSYRAIYHEGNGLISIIESFEDEASLRDYLTKEVAGFGLKQSSMFLRNIGVANELAIIDTHVLQFLMDLLDFPHKRPNALSRSLYIQIEEVLRDLCAALDLDLPAFDLAIWHYMRGV